MKELSFDEVSKSGVNGEPAARLTINALSNDDFRFVQALNRVQLDKNADQQMPKLTDLEWHVRREPFSTKPFVIGDGAPPKFEPRFPTINEGGLPKLEPIISTASEPINLGSLWGPLAPSDRPGGSKYPLPLEQGPKSGEAALQELNTRITQEAVDKVQKNMTPEQRKQLNQDAAKYAEDYAKYEELAKQEMMQHYFRTRPEDWAQPPKKPQSMIDYEAAVDKEINNIVNKRVKT